MFFAVSLIKPKSRTGWQPQLRKAGAIIGRSAEKRKCSKQKLTSLYCGFCLAAATDTSLAMEECFCGVADDDGGGGDYGSGCPAAAVASDNIIHAWFNNVCCGDAANGRYVVIMCVCLECTPGT